MKSPNYHPQDVTIQKLILCYEKSHESTLIVNCSQLLLQTTNEQTMVEVDHSNIPDLSFLLLAVTVDGIVGQSAPFYSEQRSHDKSKESEIPLVWSDDSDYYYYGESDEADSADNDFSLLFGRPPPAPSTIKPTTTINHFFTYSSASTDRVGSTSVPGRSATDNYHRNLQNARVQYTTSGIFQLYLCTSVRIRI